MVAFLRQFLVVLLVLLQNAAPLVHAHTGGNISQRGPHLHEFEALRLITDTMSFAAAGQAMDTEHCIVNMGSAINQPATPDATVACLCLGNDDQGIAIARDADLVNFSPQVSGFIPRPPISDNGSRAPPL